MTAATEFTPPASYDEAKALMGSTVVCPDGVARPVYGAGMSGDAFSVHFGAAGAHVASWSSVNGFETEAQSKARRWDAEWSALADDARALVVAVFGDVAARDDRATLKAGAKIVTAAKARLVKAGKVELATCGRCGGSGHFSYNQISGTTCFGCGGSGKRYPSTREALRCAA